MKNPFGSRTPTGEYEFPFHVELDNPTSKEEVETYAASKGAATQTKSWVDVLIRLQNGIQVPSRVCLINGKFASVHYPDGKTTGTWSNRRDVALDYVASEWRRAAQKPTPPSTPTPSRPTAKAATTPKISKVTNVMIWTSAITLVGIILLSWYFWPTSKPESATSDATGIASLQAPKPSNGGNNINSQPVKPSSDESEAPATVVTHGDLKVTMACEPGNKEILCAGLIENIGNEDGDFYITGTDYPKHGWARDREGDLARIIVDVEHFQLGNRTHWNNWHVWMPAKSVTKFWFSYESHNPDVSEKAHIDLDMMWGGNNSLGFDLPNVPINRTTYRTLEQ
jgi:hypothetical protein